MKYAFEVQADGTKAVYVFGSEARREEWIAASPSYRGILSGNSREVKAALYRDAVLLVPNKQTCGGL